MVVAVACTTFRHARVVLSPPGVQPVLPVAHRTLFCQTAARKRSSWVCNSAVVPACGAAGGALVGVPSENDAVPEHPMVTLCESGAPPIVKTATVLDCGARQFASLAISYAVLDNPNPITGSTPIGPPAWKATLLTVMVPFIRSARWISSVWLAARAPTVPELHDW